MNWKNLSTFDCPHCSSKLVRGDGEIFCSECTFVISKARFHSISVHRSGNRRPDGIKPMKWQNLRKDVCPLCDNTLVYNMESGLDLMKCMTPDCTFKIRQDRLEDILNDENHLCNIFYRMEQEKQLPDNE